MRRQEIHDELDRVCADFAALIDQAPVAEMRKPSDGTKWTNEQLLFHMLFGYLLVRNLLPLVRAFARLPDQASAHFAAALNAAAGPFHQVNYLGSLGGARVLGYHGMQGLMRRVMRDLHRSLDRRTDAQLERGMHFPTGWDPYFRNFMTLREVYHYPTQHYEHHRRQLTLTSRVSTLEGSA
jgi:hypothetical protein